MDSEAVRDEKLKVLRAPEAINDSNVEHMTVRGQYRAGAICAGGPVKGYLEELEEAASPIRNLCCHKAEINNWRWAGVPFTSETGKRPDDAHVGNRHYFKPIPHNIFEKRCRPYHCQPADHSSAAGMKASSNR